MKDENIHWIHMQICLAFMWGVISIVLSPIVLGVIPGVVGIHLALSIRRSRRSRRFFIPCLATPLLGFLASLGFGVFYLYILSQSGWSPPGWMWVIFILCGVVASAGAGVFIFGAWIYWRSRRPKTKTETDKTDKAIPAMQHLEFGDCTLRRAEEPLRLENLWTQSDIESTALCVGDWNMDGEVEILLADRQGKLHVFDLMGQMIQTVALPSPAARIECGHIDGKPALLSHRLWGAKVHVIDQSGTELWSYSNGPGVKWGINSARWCDIDGDGNDEMIVGMMGRGGFTLVDHRGKKIWQKKKWFNTARGAWGQSGIPKTTEHGSTLFTMGTGHIVHWLSNKKKGEFKTVTPNDLYPITFEVARVDGGDRIQLVTISTTICHSSRPSNSWIPGIISGCDVEGRVEWKTPVWTAPIAWARSQISHGDINGDGVQEWAFIRDGLEVVVASPEGERLANLKFENENAPFQVELIKSKSGYGCLAACHRDGLSLWQFQAPTNDAPDSSSSPHLPS